MNEYLIEVFWSAEDRAFVAVVPDLPGCSAVGDSGEEAIRELGDAIAAWIEACRASGEAVPKPSARPQLAGVA
jgi:predicted RNase H-like HicB family nuclease